MILIVFIIIYVAYQVLKKPANDDITLTIMGYTSTPMRYKIETKEEKQQRLTEKLLQVKRQSVRGRLSIKEMNRLMSKLNEIDQENKESL